MAHRPALVGSWAWLRHGTRQGALYVALIRQPSGQPALGDLRKGLVASLCNHTSVVCYDAWPASHGWV
jgi:hypothetical protein